MTMLEDTSRTSLPEAAASLSASVSQLVSLSTSPNQMVRNEEFLIFLCPSPEADCF